MKTPTDIIEEILRVEGGYVDDPDDRGGPTKHGITIHTLRKLGIDLDNDGDVDAEDVKLITHKLAADILLQHYYHKPQIARVADKYPIKGVRVRAAVTDWFTNSGKHAIIGLQRVLKVNADGKIGRRTIVASNKVTPDKLANDYSIYRREWYCQLADRRPNNRKYARTRRGQKGGWIKRAEDYMDPKLRWSQAEFDARTKDW